MYAPPVTVPSAATRTVPVCVPASSNGAGRSAASSISSASLAMARLVISRWFGITVMALASSADAIPSDPSEATRSPAKSALVPQRSRRPESTSESTGSWYASRTAGWPLVSRSVSTAPKSWSSCSSAVETMETSGSSTPPVPTFSPSKVTANWSLSVGAAMTPSSSTANSVSSAMTRTGGRACSDWGVNVSTPRGSDPSVSWSSSAASVRPVVVTVAVNGSGSGPGFGVEKSGISSAPRSSSDGEVPKVARAPSTRTARWVRSAVATGGSVDAYPVA